MDFYNNIATNYDEMTRFSERLENERDLLQKWHKKYVFQSVVDVACGTGLHAVLFAEMGLKTVGADISEAMLAKAKTNAKKVTTPPVFVLSSMQDLHKNIKGTFDALFCLGNSIPHIPKADIYNTVSTFKKLLNPGSILVLQLLNYRKTLEEKNRIVGIHSKGNRQYIRFYDFEKDHLRFNLLTITWDGQKNSHSLNSTILYPYQKEELEKALKSIGFHQFEIYGNMNFDRYFWRESPNLVLVGKMT